MQVALTPVEKKLKESKYKLKPYTAQDTKTFAA